MNANDNSKDDPAPFIQLAAIVANVVRYLEGRKEQKEHGDRDAGCSDADEKCSNAQRETVNQHLSEPATFDRRVIGIKN